MMKNILYVYYIYVGCTFLQMQGIKHHVITKYVVLVGELFGNILIHCHLMPYDIDIEIKNDVNIIAI